ncbi:hypothetical protein GOODEAATRI_033180 [Goodea atripinnis]|uniref:Uncharacterized protein n=1 Tax=Goodea atripinnis TaxID=208336 RepID=A0ABV0N672_9TELE
MYMYICMERICKEEYWVGWLNSSFHVHYYVYILLTVETYYSPPHFISEQYITISESRDLVVESQGHYANAIKLVHQVSLGVSIIHTLRAYIFYCWRLHQP